MARRLWALAGLLIIITANARAADNPPMDDAQKGISAMMEILKQANTRYRENTHKNNSVKVPPRIAGQRTTFNQETLKGVSTDLAFGIARDLVAEQDPQASRQNNQTPPQEQKPKLTHQWIQVGTGGEAKFYQPDFKRSEEATTESIHYDVDPTWSYNAQAKALILNGQPIFTWEKSWASQGKLNQSQTIEAQQKKIPTGFESLQLGLNAKPIVQTLMQDDDGKINQPILATLLSLNVAVEESTFFGRAQAMEPSAIVHSGSTVNGTTLSGNITPLNTGDSLGFKTVLQTWKVGIDPTVSMVKVDPETWFRIGYYDMHYRRPTDNWDRNIRRFSCTTCGAGTRHLLFDADYHSQGIDFDGQIAQAKPGSHHKVFIGGNLRYGVWNEITLHDSSVSLYDKDLGYTNVGLRLGWKYAGPVVEALKLDAEFDVTFDFQMSSWSTTDINTIIKESDMRETVMAHGAIRF